jgi:hypothetical protein
MGWGLRVLAGCALVCAFFAVGRVAAADAATLPAELNYAERTTPYSATATAGAVVSGSSITLDGATPIIVHFDAYAAQAPGTAGAALIFELFDGSTSLGKIAGIVQPVAGSGVAVPIASARRLLPSSGAHTYSVKAWTTTGTGSVNAGTGAAGADGPAALRIEQADPPTSSSTVNALGTDASPNVVRFSADDAQRNDLVWWGVWFLCGVMLLHSIAPPFLKSFRFWSE